jgi:hypothetical protein
MHLTNIGGEILKGLRSVLSLCSAPKYSNFLRSKRTSFAFKGSELQSRISFTSRFRRKLVNSALEHQNASSESFPEPKRCLSDH